MTEEQEEKNYLHHVWTESEDDFFTRVDKVGGWPSDKKYVSFLHSDERKCEFTEHYLRTEWWTTVYSCDDYYWWKVSTSRKEDIKHHTRMEFAGEVLRSA